MWGIFFGEFQCLPVNGCSAVSCDSGALARGSESTSFYSAILNQDTNTFSLKHSKTKQNPVVKNTLMIKVVDVKGCQNNSGLTVIVELEVLLT